ncbi:MAG: cellulose synthase complex periplasmic endoglucanase BcsZ [Bryobacteraceae bacterium]
MRTPLVTVLTALLLACSVHAKTTWPLWESYTSYFLEADGRIVDHDANDRTTSEAQAYALFFSLVANDRARFDSVLSWTNQNLAQGNLSLHLPAWQWEKGRGAWRESDKNSAADADLWLAYTLLQAGRLWHDSRLVQSGHVLADRILAEEAADIPRFGPMLMPGSFGFTNADGSFELNPSYVPVQLLLGIGDALRDQAWRNIAANVPKLLRGSSPSGFILDWIAFRAKDGFSVYPLPAPEPLSSYDAIRVYLWAGMLDSASPFRPEVLSALSGMARYMADHRIPPAEVQPDGRVRNANGSVGFSAALLPFLSANNLKSAADQQMKRMQLERSGKTGLFGSPPRYYDQNLALFGTGWCEGRFKFEATGTLKVSWN